MGVKESICLSIKRCCYYSGRANRTEFWVFNLVTILIFLFSFTLLVSYSYLATSMGVSKSFLYVYYYLVISVIILSACFGLLVSLCGLSLMVRRLHDINRSGFWVVGVYLLSLIALLFFYQNDLINSLSYILFYSPFWIGFLIFLSMPGDKQANYYGSPQ
ncbi:MAG TPA: DUF805 domain-containing protein [Gammaproteobacteria bacterium]|nr:DUF805 domain-containing protein [Gammaproteobacteria bacterium]